MTEKELISKIESLRQIKPRKDWVILTKSQILGKETPKISLFESLGIIFSRKPVLVGIASFLLIFGLFFSSQSALPGDLLYPIKKITEKSQTIFASKDQETKIQLELANKRLEELRKIAEANQIKNLAPAIEEYQKTVSNVAENLKKKPIKATKEIVQETKKLIENQKKAESLGIVISDDIQEAELNEAYKTMAEREIKNLENSSLTEKQEELLKEAKECFEKGDYKMALIKTVEASQK